MSSLSDIFNFEKFNLKDMLSQIKSHPQRLLFGVDPLATKLENTVTGSHFTPIVDQMGGAYGGHTFSAFGNKDGGVYQRAQAAGIDTGAGGKMQDAAHVIAALIAGNYGLGKLGGGNGQSGGSDWQDYSNYGTSSDQQSQQKRKAQSMPLSDYNAQTLAALLMPQQVPQNGLQDQNSQNPFGPNFVKFSS